MDLFALLFMRDPPSRYISRPHSGPKEFLGRSGPGLAGLRLVGNLRHQKPFPLKIVVVINNTPIGGPRHDPQPPTHIYLKIAPNTLMYI